MAGFDKNPEYTRAGVDRLYCIHEGYKVVCKSFHGMGIVVLVDDNEVGYRPVPESEGMLM